ncbi:MAG: thiolase family protein [Chloroflexota bacterium]|nr:thiolase family protein [Chloroflexota bacterium]
MNSLRGKAAIVGVGELKPIKKAPDDKTGYGLAAESAAMAIADAGLAREDIDAILIEPPLVEPHMGPPSYMAEYLGIPIRYGATGATMGASAASMVWRAAAAISAGLCHTVLCITGELIDPMKMAMLMSKYEPGRGLFGPEEQYSAPYGPAGAPTSYAHIATRHAFEYGTTDEQRARIAVDQRTNACANPKAMFYGRPITIEDVINSRVISSPLRLLEIVMPVSGAASVVVTSAERAKAMRHPPCYILGAGEYISYCDLTESPHTTTSPVKESARVAFEMSGYNARDMQMVQAYDCFTITVMITLEDAGFCPKGESGPFCWETDMTYKGKLPVNTHGGQLSFGQAGLAGGMSHITEGALQIMGRGEERQIKDLDIGFINGNGGYMSEQTSLIFGTEATL